MIRWHSTGHCSIPVVWGCLDVNHGRKGYACNLLIWAIDTALEATVSDVEAHNSPLGVAFPLDPREPGEQAGWIDTI